jgi:hypothetical protein
LHVRSMCCIHFWVAYSEAARLSNVLPLPSESHQSLLTWPWAVPKLSLNLILKVGLLPQSKETWTEVWEDNALSRRLRYSCPVTHGFQVYGHVGLFGGFCRQIVPKIGKTRQRQMPQIWCSQYCSWCGFAEFESSEWNLELIIPGQHLIWN